MNIGILIESERLYDLFGDHATLETRDDGFYYSVIDGIRRCHASYELAYGYIHRCGYRE